MFPEEMSPEVIENVLLKALMAFPATDFSLCMYQIPEKYRKSSKEVIQLAQWLERWQSLRPSGRRLLVLRH